MSAKYIPRIIIAMLGTVMVLGMVNAIAASNTISSTLLEEQSTAIAINDKKPVVCTMVLTAIIVCTGGNCNGSPGSVNDLILGTAGNDKIIGKNGDDCIVAGGGDDDIGGDNGTDVCIGGPGNDVFDLAKCETIIDP